MPLGPVARPDGTTAAQVPGARGRDPAGARVTDLWSGPLGVSCAEGRFVPDRSPTKAGSGLPTIRESATTRRSIPSYLQGPRERLRNVAAQGRLDVRRLGYGAWMVKPRAWTSSPYPCLPELKTNRGRNRDEGLAAEATSPSDTEVYAVEAM